jgi:hypothetical protein
MGHHYVIWASDSNILLAQNKNFGPPVKLFIGCFFFFVQLNNYVSNLSLLKYFIQKIYGKRDISGYL